MGTTSPLPEALRVLQAETETLGAVVAEATYTRKVTPNYAGERTKTWDPFLHLYNAESAALRDFRALVAQGRKGTREVRVVAMGDSKTAGTGLEPGKKSLRDSYPSQLRDLLGADDGLIYIESGSAEASHWSGKAGFLSTTPATLSRAAPGAGTATITFPNACTGVRFYAHNPLDFTAMVDITVDGAAPVERIFQAGNGFKALEVTGLTNAPHTVKLATRGAATLLAAEPRYNTPRLTVSTAARTGSSAAHWNTAGWSGMFESVFGASNPQVPTPHAVIMNLGTNGSPLENLEEVAAKIRALGLPLLLVVPGGLSWADHHNALRSKIYDIADVQDLPLLDFTNLIGGTPEATASGLMADAVHENSRGYSLEAAAVARAISL